MNRMAERIMKARLKAKLSEKQLAKKCGLTAGYIIQIESGKKIIKESVAEKILETLGEDVERIIPDTVEEVAVRPKPVVKEAFNVKPNSQWSKALEGVIKKYPVIDLASNKVVAYKELPIMGRKVEGFHSEKISFIRYNETLVDFRIHRNDTVMLLEEKDLKNDKLYLLEIHKRKMIRRVRKESNNRLIISVDKNQETRETYSTKDVILIGRCLKVEFDL